MTDVPIDRIPSADSMISTRVPVYTPEGASDAAYEDPTSPESILRRTRQTQVQSEVDRKYDLPVKPYENFSTQESSCIRPSVYALVNTPLTPILTTAIALLLRKIFQSSR